jgi:hypothetical protein
MLQLMRSPLGATRRFMSHKANVQAQYAFLSLPVLQDGLDGALEWERLGLADLYVKEVRKGAFRPSEGIGDDQLRRDFLLHVQREFVDSEDVKEVLDFQPRLLASARLLASRPHPIEAVILYATWMEHWLNAVLLTTMLRKRMTESHSLQLIRQSNMDAKLGGLWSLIELPALPEEHIRRIKFLAAVRNEHVHYKWEGRDPDVLYGPTSRLTLAVADMDRTVQDLVDFEINLFAPEIAAASRLFAVDLRPSMRKWALEWQELKQASAESDA